MTLRRLIGLVCLLILMGIPLLRHAPQRASAQGCYQSDNLAALGRPSPTAQRLAGATLVTGTAPTGAASVYTVRAGDTLGQIAAAHGVSISVILGANNITNPNLIYPGQRIHFPGVVRPASTVQLLQNVWTDGTVMQGETVTFWAQAPAGSTVIATRGTQTVQFHARCGLQWGLMAFDALRDEPGVHTVRFTVTDRAGQQSVSEVAVTLLAGSFWEGPPLRFPASKQPLLDRAVIDGENGYLAARFEAETNPRSEPMWSGLFAWPINSRVTGSFGSRGIVNGEYTGYHEGLDLRGPTGTPVYASAAGRVVLSENLRVRGGTVFIDHGAGVISGYFHLSGFAASFGDYVDKGDLLGWTGSSGLTTAPHLHWEMRVNNRWVNPVPWLDRYYP